MKKLQYFIATIVILITLTSCSMPKFVIDREKQEAIFFKCLEKIPKGPTTVKYNDWDDVVRECNTISVQMSGEWREE